MGMALHRRTRRMGKRRQQMAEINVTPFVDVMLVLLIIFMVAAPLLTVGVQVDLPQSKAKAIEGQDEPLAVSIDDQGRIFLQDTVVELDELSAKMNAIGATNPDLRIFIRADAGISYGRVMEVMGELTSAGYRKVGLITRPAIQEP
ncbi:MAG: protein TolR [Magnetovibrionaceae bacterium]